MSFARPILFSLALCGAPVLHGCSKAENIEASDAVARPRAALSQVALSQNASPQSALSGETALRLDTNGTPRDASTGADNVARRVSGQILPPFSDDSGWAKVSVAYEVPSENGQKFQRVRISNLESGRAQIKAPLPAFTRDSIFSLRLRVRGTAELPVVIGLRGGAPAYKFEWQDNATISSDWQTVNANFALPANLAPDAQLGFYFYISGTGTLDIAEFELSAVPRAQYEANLRQKASTLRQTNLFPVSRFPLGLQAGCWLRVPSDSVSPEAASEPVAVSDSTQLGPSGSPALRVTSQQNYNLYLPPFSLPLPFDPHVASVYLKGQGTVSLVSLIDDTVLTRQSITLEPNWKRYSLAFSPDLVRQNYAIRLDGSTGTVWLDGVQVERATAPSPLEKRPEVALRVVSRELPAQAFTNIQFASEKPLVEWSATQIPKGAKLRVDAFDLYGATRALPSIALRDGNSSGSLSFEPLLKARNLGAFRIEARVVDGSGKTISPVREIVVNRMRRPRFWKRDAPDSPFGVHLYATQQNIAMAKAIGLNWTRLHDAGSEYIGWRFLEPQKGVWKWRDAEIERLRRENLEILGAFSTSPEWASFQSQTSRKGKNGYWDRFFQPRDLGDYENYVSRVTERYRSKISVYEVWNEPWIREWFAVDFDEKAAGGNERLGYRTSQNPQKDFAAMMQSAWKAAKATDPQVQIVGFNSSYLEKSSDSRISGTQWTRGVAQHGGLAHSDIVSYHHYSAMGNGFAGDEVEIGFKNAIGPLLEGAPRAARAPRPVWMTEGSPFLGIPRTSGIYRHTLASTNGDVPTRAADGLVRYSVSLLGNGVEKFFLYSMHGHGFFGNTNPWGVFTLSDNTLHPMGAAFSNMAWHLEDRTFHSTLEIAPNITAMIFAAKSNPKSDWVAVVMPRDGAKGTAPAGATDLWGNPLADKAEIGVNTLWVTHKGSLESLRARLTKK